MEPGWAPGDPNPSAGPSQAFSSWPENLLSFDLDGSNLAPALSGGASSKIPSGSMAEEEVQRKRRRELLEKESLDMFLAELGKEPPPASGPEAAGSGSNEDAAGLGAGLEGDRRTDAKLPDATSAARNKACRERMRRERLNDSFAELSKVLEPGKQVKIDKTSIIADAIRAITQLRSESNQLRQLNKFLEERVGQCEKQKSDLMLQQAMLQGASGSAHPFGMPHPGMMQGVSPAGLPGLDPTAQHGMQPLPGIHPAFLASMHQMHAQQGVQQAHMQHQLHPQVPQQLPAQQQQQPQQQSLQQPHMAPMPNPHGSLLHPTNSLGHSHSVADSHKQQSAPKAEQKSPGTATPQSLQSLQSGQGMTSGQIQDHRMQPSQPGHDLPGMSFSFLANPATLQQQQQQASAMRMQGSMGLGFPNSLVKHESQLGGFPGADPLRSIGSSPLGLVAGIPVAGPNCWLPPSTLDTSQDHMRRPPAA